MDHIGWQRLQASWKINQWIRCNKIITCMLQELHLEYKIYDY